jgi:ATP-binding cassette subfamily C protein
VIAGENGAGKSTLINILLGLHMGEYKGDILYNGISVNEVDMYDFRKNQVGISEQEPLLIADTIRYNISLCELPTDGERRQNVTDINPIDKRADKQNELVSMLGLNTYADALHDGFETVINENAANISGGEKQKISLLRALMKGNNLIVLDEPTSALDEHSKSSLRGYLDMIKHEKIVIVVTHDKGFINEVIDNIILMKSGSLE